MCVIVVMIDVARCCSSGLLDDFSVCPGFRPFLMSKANCWIEKNLCVLSCSIGLPHDEKWGPCPNLIRMTCNLHQLHMIKTSCNNGRTISYKNLNVTQMIFS